MWWFIFNKGEFLYSLTPSYKVVKSLAALRPAWWLLRTPNDYLCSVKHFAFSRRCVPRRACSVSQTRKGASQAKEGELIRYLCNGPVCFSLVSNKQHNPAICEQHTICSALEANKLLRNAGDMTECTRKCLINAMIDVSSTCLYFGISYYYKWCYGMMDM